MRAVVQRVSGASVRVGPDEAGAIGPGLVVLLGVADGDGGPDVRYVIEKIRSLRIFPDEAGQMNRSLAESGGSVLVVSQFTLMGDVRRGRRPSWSAAAPPDLAQALYEQVCTGLRDSGLVVATGVFRAMMEVHLVNSGPVTVLLDSRKTF
jgi:D-tyrosyl-tRNA(Tyr) deacylase